ncbi:MAG: hypothetical protein HOE86_00685, partial [Gemmatimonadetes bacterium]|nr:hypothetical protein [Gemmatimonadota bacterium]
MKITALRATPVRIPRPTAFVSSLGTHAATENAVIEIETDAGLTGIGESSSIWDRMGPGCADDINGLLAGLLIGRDATRIRELTDLMDAHLDRAQPAKAGIEMALWDLLGKSVGAPVFQLLGGAVRDKVELSRSLSMGTVEQVVEQAERLVGEGYLTLKMKVGRDPTSDHENLEALRSRFPDLKLRVDANMGWRNPKEAVRHIHDLEAFNIEL